MIDTQEKKLIKGSSSSDSSCVQQVKPQVHPNPGTSASSSPSHDFSFTVSLYPPNTNMAPPPAALAVDLTPADEIFFHGHLLPLHLLSHLSVSPRASTNSLDSFTLPINELLQHNTTDEYTANHSSTYQEASLLEPQPRRKAKSFSLFGLPKWRKGNEEDHHQDDEHKKRKLKLDIGHILKRYTRLVKPFLFLRNRKGNPQIHRQQQPYSFSGNFLMRNNKAALRSGRRGEFSAPGSMRTSPTNSGLLVASGTVTPTTSTDSTMEELQAAIQAAIAHCKKSISTEDIIRSNCHS